MRPRNLRLRGFTCYSDEVEIDFSKMDLFVISGPTGSGKSTLIDAICYALYGRVPRVEGTAALMSHNRDEMFVHLEFSVNRGDDVYRVIRTINHKKKTAKDGTEKVTKLPSLVQLEKYVDGVWEPQAGKVKDINHEIEELLGLDFTGFTRCIVLPQGQFQEFLSGDAQKRRELLTELLDIGVYARIMTAANGRARSLEQDAGAIDRRLTEDYADATQEALDATRAELTELAPQLDATRGQRAALQQAVELAAGVRDARRRERALREDHTKALEEAERLKKLAAEGQHQVATMRADIASIEKDLASVGYDRERHRALGLAEQQARRVAQIERDLAGAQKAAADASGVGRAEQACAQTRQAATDATAQREAAETHREDVRRGQAAEHLRSGLKKGDMCPVCGGAVGTLPRGKAGSIDAAEKAVKAAQAVEKKSADALHAAELALQREQQALDTARDQATRLDADAGAARKQLAASLPKGVAPDEQAILAALKTQDEAAARETELTGSRDDARRALDELQPQVEDAAIAVAKREESATQLIEQAKSAGAEAASAREDLTELTARWCWDDVRAEIEGKRDPQPLLKTRRDDCQAEADRMTARVATLEASAGRIEEGIAKAADLRVELEEKRGQAALYAELGRLLRADNFQKFVIEEAMQALAESATQHLATLYDRFAMTVDDGEFCVIDHWQADQRRSARTLSGGETFVASLALALALSERLPELRNRNAAVLESLFLDEGFGTLDPDVLEVVITALEGLRSEERMVGIITHVPELARRIDARIEVTKSPAGSMAAVG
ncbi:MAG TPA: SMC family ATPase [Dehalococcoidia bacterium]|nr:SMC family ATPase [Dehalococcoidia bacterium]